MYQVTLVVLSVFTLQALGNVIPEIKPSNLTLAAKEDEIIIDDTQEFMPFLDAPRFFVPTYFYPVGALPSEAVAINDIDKDDSELQPVESRVNPGFAFLIVLPKVLYKFVKSLAKTVVVASGLGLAGLAISTLICTFTPICVLSFAWPGLRNLEQSGRNLVENFSEQVPLDKLESLMELLSVAMDRYSTVKTSQARNLQRSQRVSGGSTEEPVEDEE